MSIQLEVQRLENAKSSIAAAIEAKGVTVPPTAKIDTYGDYVAQISVGGGTYKIQAGPTMPEEAEPNTIFIKYSMGGLVWESGFRLILATTRPDTAAAYTLFLGINTTQESSSELSYTISLTDAEIWDEINSKWQRLDGYVSKNGQWVQFSDEEFGFFALSGDETVSKYSRDGKIMWSQQVDQPRALCLDYAGNHLFVYSVFDTTHFRIRCIDAATGSPLGFTYVQDYGNEIPMENANNQPVMKLSPDRKYFYASSNADYDLTSHGQTVKLENASAIGASPVLLAPQCPQMDIPVSGEVLGVLFNPEDGACPVYNIAAGEVVFNALSVYPMGNDSHLVMGVSPEGNIALKDSSLSTFYDVYLSNKPDEIYPLESVNTTATNSIVWVGDNLIAEMHQSGVTFYSIDTDSYSMVNENGALFDHNCIIGKRMTGDELLVVTEDCEAYIINTTSGAEKFLTTLADTIVEVEPGNYTTFPSLFSS